MSSSGNQPQSPLRPIIKPGRWPRISWNNNIYAQKFVAVIGCFLSKFSQTKISPCGRSPTPVAVWAVGLSQPPKYFQICSVLTHHKFTWHMYTCIVTLYWGLQIIRNKKEGFGFLLIYGIFDDADILGAASHGDYVGDVFIIWHMRQTKAV